LQKEQQLLDVHLAAAENEYPDEFMGRKTLQYYIDWFQLHNNVEHVEETVASADMDEDSCALDEPEAKCPKVVPRCN
jgi:hypothetical protein